MTFRIPVCRPKLPSAGTLLPYLETIDQNRFYSNHGPMSRELEARIAEWFELEQGRCLATGTGSSALFGLLNAVRIRDKEKKPLCLTSAFGFSASAAAIKLAGLTPCFLDIDHGTWQISPDRVRAHPRLEEAAAVMPVAPFGRRIDLAGWARFEQDTGIPVIIDAAASFDTLAPSDMAALEGISGLGISLHATKFLPAGEGGLAFSRSQALISLALASINHGFKGQRDSVCDSMNGKISEYHSAVALASLDAQAQSRQAWSRVHGIYQRHTLPDDVRLWLNPDLSAVYAIAEFASEADCMRVERTLNDKGIQTLRWYGRGLHRQTVYAELEHGGLGQTDELSARLLGLPMYVDLSEDEIGAILAGLDEGMTR